MKFMRTRSSNGHPYNAVVRQKDLRRQMEAVECEQCANVSITIAMK